MRTRPITKALKQILCVFQPNRVIVHRCACVCETQSMHCQKSLSPKLMPIEACYEFPEANTVSIRPSVQRTRSALLHSGNCTANMGGEFFQNTHFERHDGMCGNSSHAFHLFRTKEIYVELVKVKPHSYTLFSAVLGQSWLWSRSQFLC